MKNVCIFCGADLGRREAYRVSAKELGNLLAKNGSTIITGGGSTGLMGAVADSALAHGGKVIGVVPGFFVGSTYNGNEVVHGHLSELRLVSSMHERKALMADLSDAFITLPGGIGTVDELVEMWTLAKLGIHSKPCGILNVEGYFNGFLEFVDHMVQEGFLEEQDRSLLVVEREAAKLLEKIHDFENSFVPSVQYNK